MSLLVQTIPPPLAFQGGKARHFCPQQPPRRPRHHRHGHPMARLIERPMHARPPALFHLNPHQVRTAGGDGRRVGPPRTASIGHRVPLSAGVLGPSPPLPLPPPRTHQRVAPSHFKEGLEPGPREPQPQLSPGISERTPILRRPKCRPFSGVGSGEPSGAFSERQHLSRVQNPRQFRVQPRLPIGGQGSLLGRGLHSPQIQGIHSGIDHFHELATVVGSMPHHLCQSQRRRWRIERRATDGAPPFRTQFRAPGPLQLRSHGLQVFGCNGEPYRTPPGSGRDRIPRQPSPTF